MLRVVSIAAIMFLINLNLKSQNKNSAQTFPNPVIVNFNINLPKDSVLGNQLIVSLNEFLVAAQNPIPENKYVLSAESIETCILLDEFGGIEKSQKFKDDYFYKPYLTNVAYLGENQFLIRLSYIGVNENTPYYTTGFELIAHKNGDSFQFSSPLVRNTKSWKTTRKGDFIFHYKDKINKENVAQFVKLATEFDKKLNSAGKVSDFYCAKDFLEAQQLIGLTNKSDYNGLGRSTLMYKSDNKVIAIFANNNEQFNEFDPHDLWHDRLSMVVPRSKVNKPIDEGCAYLYGGSWGMSWQDILKRFKTKIANKKNNDWADYKENPIDFGETKEKHLFVDYVINALLVEKIEKEKGFAGVWKFLNCGKFEKGNENYYKTLEELLGINKVNYNERITELVSKL